MLDDIIYGKFEVNEPVIAELLATPLMQRLKGISSGGYYPAEPIIAGHYLNRYDHSIGVFLLLRKFGALLEEQIAGLLHDVSHSAFSHTIDYIKRGDENSQKNHNHQDSIHNEFIKNSEIKAILEKYGFDVDYILDDKNFPLKENDLPNICADRIDYSLRAIPNIFPEIAPSFWQGLINGLTIHNNEFVFSSYQAAFDFADNFKKLDKINWSGLTTAIFFSYSSRMFKYALDKGYIEYDDFYKYADDEIIAKLKPIKDEGLQYFFDCLNKPSTYYRNDINKFVDKVFCKVRRVDPKFLEDGVLKKVSEVNSVFKQSLLDAPKFYEYFVSPPLDEAI